MASRRARHLASGTAKTLAGILAIVLLFPTAQAGASDPTQEAVDLVTSQDPKLRVVAAQSLIDDWRTSLPVLIKKVGDYAPADSGPPYAAADVPALVALTDVIRSIVVNKDGAIHDFRELDDDNKAIRLLAWAARGTDQSLRLNATYILANVVDNTNICIVLHHLRDPAISDEGLANLVQAAFSVTSYAYQENVQAVGDTIKMVGDRLGPKAPPATRAFLDTLSRRIAKSANAGTKLPPELRFCASYNYGGPL